MTRHTRTLTAKSQINRRGTVTSRPVKKKIYLMSRNWGNRTKSCREQGMLDIDTATV